MFEPAPFSTTVVRMNELAMTVAAAEANRRFSQLLRAARSGARITITSHGEPVAEMGPYRTESGDAEDQRLASALKDLQAHWARLTPVSVEPWTRDELYERERG